MKKIIGFIMTAFVLCLILSSGNAFAQNDKEAKEEHIQLSKEDQEQIASLLFQYFDGSTSLEKINGIKNVSKTVLEDAQKKLNAFLETEKRMNLHYDEIVHNIEISSEVHGDEKRISVSAYDATVITYHAPDNEEMQDICAYGVWHTMALSKTDKGWFIDSDSFDERDVTGAASSDVWAKAETTGYESSPPDYNHRPFSKKDETRATQSFNYTAGRVRTALNYAVTYCGLSKSARMAISNVSWADSHSNGNPGNYNPLYHSYHVDGDCCNFFSQCLYAAGHPTDSEWYFTTTYPNGQPLRKGSLKWIRVAECPYHFIHSATNYSDFEVNSYSDLSRLFPGNPLYYFGSPTDHIMICVGYNSSGVPVLCGHTTDIYRWPASNYLGRNMYTFQIATSNMHSSHTYVYEAVNAYVHHKICAYCEYRHSTQPHTFSNNVCTYCGYHR